MPARPTLRRPSIAVNAVLGVAVAAGAFWAYETVQGPDTGAASAATRTVPVLRGTVTQSVSADGTVQSASTASAGFVTGGTVTAIDVHVGDKVKKGQVLAKVDPAAANRTLDAARADLDAADDALVRARDAGSDTSSAEDSVTQARLAVERARAAVDGTVLKAPMAGTVTAVNGTLGSSSGGTGSASSSSGGGSTGGGSTGGGQNGGGQNGGGQNGGGAQTGSGSSPGGTGSSSSTGFIDIADLSRMQVTASFAEADATKLKERQAATITWNALSGTRQGGKVVAIDPSASTSNNVVTYGVTLSLDTVPPGARVGQTVSVSVTTGQVTDAVYANSAAVTAVGNRHTVTVLADGQRQTRAVEIGLVGDQTTQMISGAQVGEQLVVTTTAITGSGTQGGFPGGGFPGRGGLTGGGGGFSGGGRVGR